eukprot:GFYU01004849.1.p1 GENE.GFYU01004849.1~~GFYU01004849.1.p1  ORF type:complete len:231 (-),score=43.77 GFYU01004849.1:77-769(-)
MSVLLRLSAVASRLRRVDGELVSHLRRWNVNGNCLWRASHANVYAPMSTSLLNGPSFGQGIRWSCAPNAQLHTSSENRDEGMGVPAAATGEQEDIDETEEGSVVEAINSEDNDLISDADFDDEYDEEEDDDLYNSAEDIIDPELMIPEGMELTGEEWIFQKKTKTKPRMNQMRRMKKKRRQIHLDAKARAHGRMLSEKRRVEKQQAHRQRRREQAEAYLAKKAAALKMEV